MLKNLFHRSSTYFIGLLLGKLLSFAAFILFARTLMPERFGDLVLYITLAQILTFFGDFGLVQWYQKRAHVENKQKLFIKTINARIVTLGITIFLAASYFYFIPTFEPTVQMLFLIGLTPFALLSVIDGYYFDLGSSQRVALKTVSKMLIFLAGFALYHNQLSLGRAVQIYIVSDVMTLLWYFPWRKLLNFSFAKISSSITILKSSFAYAFLSLTSFAYARGDSLVVKYVAGSTALGIYGAAYRFLEGIALIPTALSHNLFPLAAREGNITKRQVSTMTTVMSTIGLLVSIILFFTASPLIEILLGSAYIAAAPILRIFALVVLLFFINSPLNTVVLSSRYVNKFLPYGTANTALNIALNIIFVPMYGVVAAAWVMLTTEITGLLINVYFVKKVYGIHNVKSSKSL